MERGSTFATLEHEWEEQIQDFNGKQIDNFIKEIKETTAMIQKLMYLKRDEIEKWVKISIPGTHKDKYLDLLFEDRSLISKDTSDLGMANNIFHSIVLKDDGPAYIKQYQIPKAHNQFIVETLTE